LGGKAFDQELLGGRAFKAFDQRLGGKGFKAFKSCLMSKTRLLLWLWILIHWSVSRWPGATSEGSGASQCDVAQGQRAAAVLVGRLSSRPGADGEGMERSDLNLMLFAKGR
jgi:hypothetical protein